MADLGAITQARLDAVISRPVASWVDYFAPLQLLTIDTSDSITVTVTLDSVVKPDAIVSLYYRTNGNMIDKQITNASGQVTFSNLDVNDTGAYFAVADIPGASLNMIVYGYL